MLAGGGPTNLSRSEISEYIFVEGYRRYESLKRSAQKHALFFVESISNAEGRVLKRLKSELHSKRKTGFERERMVAFLLEKNYTPEQIASNCGVAKETIKRYMKSMINKNHLLKSIIKRRCHYLVTSSRTASKCTTLLC